MGKQVKNEGFLTEEGQIIFDRIKAHCVANNILFEIDEFELAMLANSFDLYIRYAKIINEEEEGVSQKPKNGGWNQVRPEYTVMKNEYQNILKHSSKFGLNPGERAKIFSGMKLKKKKGFQL